MAESLIGIDIGRSIARLACRDVDLRFITRSLPENIITNEGVSAPQVLADFFKSIRREEHLGTRNCALVLSDEMALFRHVSLPPMSISELKINLPFEFRDYITDDPDNYVYDYAVDKMVKDEDGNLVRMELFAAAARKNLITALSEIFRRAGFKLKIVKPAPMAYMDLFRALENTPLGTDVRNFVIVDIRHDHIPITLYQGTHYESSRVAYMGCVDIDNAISEAKGVDRHIAESYRADNFEGVLDGPECAAVYDSFVFEISKVVNFYNFSNPDKEIDAIYLAGEGAGVPQLVSAVTDFFDYPVYPIRKLMGPEASSKEGASVCALAYAGLFAGEA